MFHVYAHLYTHHHGDIEHAALNCYMTGVFKHFVYFIVEFQLVEETELAPLRTLIDQILTEEAKA